MGEDKRILDRRLADDANAGAWIGWARAGSDGYIVIIVFPVNFKKEIKIEDRAPINNCLGDSQV